MSRLIHATLPVKKSMLSVWLFKIATCALELQGAVGVKRKRNVFLLLARRSVLLSWVILV